MFDKRKLSPDNPMYPGIDDVNDAIRKVRMRVADEIKVGDDHLPSGLYPDAKCYLQAHVRRALMFLDGGAHALEAGYGLVMLSCARSLYESAACIHDFSKRLCEKMDADDVVGAAQFVHERTFATRFEVQQMNNETFDYTAVNILKQIDALGKLVPSARRSHDQLSETAHPNAHGAHLYFETTRDNGIARFGASLNESDLYGLLVSAASLLSLFNRAYLDIDISFLGLMERELGARINDYERRKALGSTGNKSN